jgi:hypothetical protein
MAWQSDSPKGLRARCTPSFWSTDRRNNTPIVISVRQGKLETVIPVGLPRLWREAIRDGSEFTNTRALKIIYGMVVEEGR